MKFDRKVYAVPKEPIMAKIDIKRFINSNSFLICIKTNKYSIGKIYTNYKEVTKLNIEQKITSMEVAEMVGKDHKELLRDIRRYNEQLDKSKIAPVDFFTESTYMDKKGEARPCYQVTKKGCEFIAHKMTGTKGTEFTAKYINRFHDMERVIAEKKPLTALEQMKIIMQATAEVDEKVDNLANDLEQFKQELPLLGVDMDEITHAVRKRGIDALGGKESHAYHDATVRGQVYSDIYRELKHQFNCHSYKALKRNQLEQALAIIEEYELPIYLQNQISVTNSQMRLEV